MNLLHLSGESTPSDFEGGREREPRECGERPGETNSRSDLKQRKIGCICNPFCMYRDVHVSSF